MGVKVYYKLKQNDAHHQKQSTVLCCTSTAQRNFVCFAVRGMGAFLEGAI
jgi:hypothetical protein